jgi:hypothetical protein
MVKLGFPATQPAKTRIPERPASGQRHPIEDRSSAPITGQRVIQPQWQNGRVQWLKTKVGSLFLSLVAKEVRERNSQRPGDQAKVQDGDVPFAALHGTDEGAMQPARFAQLSLGQFSGRPQLPDAESHLLQKFSIVDVHA